MKAFLVMIVFFLLTDISFSQWVQQTSNTTENLNDIHFINDSTGFIVGDHGVFLKTSDYGQTWDKLVINPADDLYAVCPLNENIIFAGGQNLYKSNNSGQTWGLVSYNLDIRELEFMSPEIGFMQTQYISECFGVHETRLKYLWTTDSGNTWQPCSELPSNYESGEIERVNSDTAYQVGILKDWDVNCQDWAYSWIYWTTNGGITWEEIGFYGTLTKDASFLHDGEGFLVATDYEIYSLYKIIGSQISPLMVFNYNNLVNLLFVNQQEGYFTNGGRIMKTNSGGILWEEDYFSPSFISEILSTENDVGYAIGNSGLILRKFINPSGQEISLLNTSISQLNFPKTNINEVSQESFILTAAGTVDITADIIAPSNFLIKTENAEEFTSQITGLTIQAQHDTTITVAFIPGSNQYYHDSLLISSNATNNPQVKIPVDGRGYYLLPEIIDNDTTYCADSVWLRSKLTVEQGRSLTFCAGTTVVVPFSTPKKEVDIVIDGSLFAIGTNEDSIYFVVDREGKKWDGMEINGDHVLDSVYLHYCVIENADKDIFPLASNGGGVNVSANKFVSIQNSTVRNCEANDRGGGIYSSGSDCRIEGCRVTGCSADYGGGIYVEGNHKFDIRNCTISHCFACNGWGGGICYQNGDGIEIAQCIISGCLSDYGGGLNLDGSSILIDSVQVFDCNAQNGGSINIEGQGTYLIANSNFSYGSANKGGGLHVGGSARVTIAGCHFIENMAEVAGGGVYSSSTNFIDVHDCEIIRNDVASGHGGGIFISGGPTSISSNQIYRNNSFNGSGGAIYCKTTSSHISNNLIKNNASGSSGAGICIIGTDPEGNNKIIQNLIYSNGAQYHNNGGGIFISGSKADIFLNTIHENYAWDYGGGIYIRDSRSARVFGNIIYNNTSNEVDFESVQNLLVSFNNIKGGWQGSGEENIELDPQFYGNPLYPYYQIDFDHSILPESPCVNASIRDTSGLGIPRFDLAGNPRFCGEYLDIGVYENHFNFQPLDSGFCEGIDFQLEVIPMEVTFDSCQWTFNSQIIPSVNSNQLMIQNPGPDNVGTYLCTFYFPESKLFSRRIYLYNKGFSPQVLEQPVGAILSLGSNYTLSFGVQSNDPATHYQWYYNETMIPDATNWWLDITNFSKAQAGWYFCTVKNTCGELTSNEALLQLSPVFVEDYQVAPFAIHPNPVLEYLTIGSQISAVRIEIVDVCGNRVANYRNINTLPVTINVSWLAPGIYLMRIDDHQNQSFFFKFLKISH